VSGSEAKEVLMISYNLDSVLGTCQVRASFFKGCNNGQELFVVNWVVHLKGCELPRIKGNKMEDPIFI
jgi:hypothetical protein